MSDLSTKAERVFDSSHADELDDADLTDNDADDLLKEIAGDDED